MASSVFYRFKSSKEPSRVTFDGTGISVFELKREIISLSGLGSGLDFELIISTVDGDREYEEDTEIVPRSTTVVAKRLPATRPGKGGAARYVSGKAPVNAKTSRKPDTSVAKAAAAQGGQTGIPVDAGLSEAQSEADRMDAVLKMGAEQWKRQQIDMANATPVHRSGNRNRQAHVPAHPPPPYYTCHRCEKKGHWLQECPENGNPAFDDMRRVKKTMGIPRSQLKVIEKKPMITDDGRVEDARPPPGVMVDANGNWVVAKPDQVAWDKYQEKATRSAAAKQEADRGSEELQRMGLECALDKSLFVEPVKTPCCSRTYCKQCIVDALLDAGLECPGCGQDGVPIDDLQPDEAVADRVEQHKRTQDTAPKPADAKAAISAAPVAAVQTQSTKTDETRDKSARGSSSSPSDPTGSKKRKAESEVEDRQAKSPKTSDAQAQGDKADDKQKVPARSQQFPAELAFLNQPPFANSNSSAPMNHFVTAQAGMNAMGMGMWTNPMMFGYGAPAGQWNGTGPFGPGGVNLSNAAFGPQRHPAPMSQAPRGPASERRHFQNQPGGAVGLTQAMGAENAYFRQPVNPHRQGRRNFARPTNFRDI